MNRRVPLLLLVLVLPSSVMAMELVTNGGFEGDLPPDWQEDTVGAATVISRSVGYDGDPDYEVLVEKGTGNGHAKLNQTVVIPSVDVAFSANAKIQVASSGGGPWAAAGVALYYEDSLGEVLGVTMILRKTIDCPWLDSDTFHMIPVADEEWKNHAFNLSNELSNLPGVDMQAIHQIRICLFGQTGGDC
jgi:hypothetical protein